MRPYTVAFVAAIGFAVVMMGMDIYVHDATLQEAWRDSPKLIVHSVFWVFSLAWQYKIAAAVVVGIFVAVIYVRLVPDIKSH